MMKSLAYHESKQRGSLDYPLDYHYIDQGHARYEMPYHWHEEFEILHVISGAFELRMDDTAYDLRAGDVAFIASGRLHGGRPDACTYECIVFDMRLMLKCSDDCKQKIADVIHGKRAINPLFRHDDPVIRHTLLPMFDALRGPDEGRTLITLGCLYQFVGEAYRAGCCAEGGAPGAEDKRVLRLKKVFELIESQYAGALTLNGLADAVHMTPKYFCRFFKEAAHCTPMYYLAYYRVEMACYKMAATEKNVTEIALDVGYGSLNYFIRMFKKYKGMTPGQYLKRLRPKG